MPWKIVKRKTQFCVVKESDGTIEACHGTRQQAVKHLRALYAATSGEQKGLDNNPFSIEFGISVTSEKDFGDSDHLSVPVDIKFRPDFALVSNDGNMTIISEFSEALDIPINSQGVTDNLKDLTFAVNPWPVNAPVSITIKPSSQEMWKEIVGDIGLNEVIAFALNDTPSGNGIKQIKSVGVNLDSSSGSLSTSHDLVNGEIYNFSKSFQVMSILLADDDMNFSPIFVATDATIGKDKSRPISRSRRELVKEVVVPFIDDKGMSKVVVIARFDKKTFEDVPIVMVLGSELVKCQSVIDSINNDAVEFGITYHDLIITQGSEMYKSEGQNEMSKKAVWSTTSDLPDSCFLYIEPGGTKKDGITHPLSLRHLPVKNSSGDYDIAHVRNAIARIPQMAGISEAKKRQLQARARRILESLNKKSLSDTLMGALKTMLHYNYHDGDFSVYKDDSGQWLWRGTYSNIFRDRDNPPEILSEKAHQTFERMTAEGIVPMPELWLWHIPSSKFGETYDVWYEDGYAKAEGTIDKGMEYIAEKLSEMEGLGMSHGMPVQFIVRNKEDNSIIDAYVSKELTVLPVAKAANLLTDFSTFKEDVMNKPITEEQKEFLASAGFDDTKIAEIAELQKKEVPDMALKTETETEVIAEVEVAQEESEEKKRAMDVKPVPAACDDEEEMDEENKKKPKKGCKKEFVTPDELETVAKATADAVTSLSQQVASLTDQLKSIADAVKSLKELDEAKVVKAAEGTPAMSMAELIRKSVIGREETKVDGRTVLAQDKPKEAKAPGNDMPIGLGFMQGIFEGKSLKESVK